MTNWEISTSARDEIERVLHPHIWARGDGPSLAPPGNDLGARHSDRPAWARGDGPFLPPPR